MAPAWAANKACPSEKINVQLVLFFCQRRNEWLLYHLQSLEFLPQSEDLVWPTLGPHLIIPSKSVDITSALTSPGTILQIFL